ncbi:ubiquitin-conjugating enzyme E2-binding protein 1 [Pelomyxa schiedti]|nr:ubiquitin-conjugating enzyme E2-binding protein 1 [Pelomyxa schiedti]
MGQQQPTSRGKGLRGSGSIKRKDLVVSSGIGSKGKDVEVVPAPEPTGLKVSTSSVDGAGDDNYDPDDVNPLKTSVGEFYDPDPDIYDDGDDPPPQLSLPPALLADLKPLPGPEPLKVLSKEEILLLQKVVMKDVASVLGVTLPVSGVLLQQFRWERSVLVDKFYDNSDDVFATAGINPTSMPPNVPENLLFSSLDATPNPPPITSPAPPLEMNSLIETLRQRLQDIRRSAADPPPRAEIPDTDSDWSDTDSPAPLPPAPAAKPIALPKVNQEHLQMLRDMGFFPGVSTIALTRTSTLEEAIAMLFEDRNSCQDEVSQAIDIDYIRNQFPEVASDSSFVSDCLLHFNHDVDLVVESILEGALPDDLALRYRTAAAAAHPVPEQSTDTATSTNSTSTTPSATTSTTSTITSITTNASSTTSSSAAAIPQTVSPPTTASSTSTNSSTNHDMSQNSSSSVASISPPTETGPNLDCPVCGCDYPPSQMFALGCKHFYCYDCWASHLRTKLEDGPTCIFTTCMAPNCKITVDISAFQKFLNQTDYQRYQWFFLKAFIDNNKKAVWCSNPQSCKWAIYYAGDSVPKPLDLTCLCGWRMCFHCREEMHSPATCDNLSEWKKKGGSDATIANWLREHTKACPKCNAFIEKNEGCMHMTCIACKHEFCWMCKAPWSTHGSHTGGYFSCNRYDVKKHDEWANKKADPDIHRYIHYFTRFEHHGNAQKALPEKVTSIKASLLPAYELINRKGNFLIEAVNLLDDCRQILKFTYVFGFFLQDAKEKLLFEFMQEDLEKATEHLADQLEEAKKDVLDEHKTTLFRNYMKVTSNNLKTFLDAYSSGSAISRFSAKTEKSRRLFRW